ncbi:MAG: iron ABC transporter substrate-binding protein [Thermodesulfovibrio sp.]|nr:iron ABC transporter substrate-binding protein [Thermodesulfovibrio sp.]
MLRSRSIFITFTITLIFTVFINQNSHASHQKIVDLEGRTIIIPQNVERVIPLGGALRFIVYLDAFEKVVGVENFEKKFKNNPLRPYSLKISNYIDKIPSIGEGGPGKIPDIEKLIELKPDLIIAMGIDKTVVNAIETKTKIPIVVLSSGGRGFFDEDLVIESLRLLGKILKKENKAEKLIKYIKKSKEDLLKRTSESASSVRVYVGGIAYGGRQGFTSTQADFMPLKWINAKNLADAIKTKGPVFLNKEQILKWNPDVIFIDLAGLELIAEDLKKNYDFYRSLKAVKEEKIYSILPYNNYHTNIEIAIANSYFMGKIIYPKKFKDIDPNKKADEIVYEFLGLKGYMSKLPPKYGFGRVILREDGVSVNFIY